MGRLYVMSKHLPRLKADDLRELGAALFGGGEPESDDPVVNQMRSMQQEAKALWSEF
jgi:hypothetical protein